MPNYSTRNDLGVVTINTSTNFERVDPGLSGVAYLNAAATEQLQTYFTLASIANDYPAGTYIYNAAAAYFTYATSPLFQVISYASSSAGANSSSEPASSDADSAVHAVDRYYDAAFEHLVIHVTSSNQAVALEVSEYVEAQHNKLLYLEIPDAAPANGSGPDFSWLAPLVGSATNKGSLSTTAQSLPLVGSDSSFNLDGAFLSKFAGAPLGTNPQFTTGLEGFANIQPQDEYDFSASDYDKYYEPYNVWTYEYRNGQPMFSSNYSLGGYQITPMLIRDAITAQVKDRILNLFIQNGGVPYNTVGINMIIDQIQMVLDSMTKAGLIKNAKADKIDADQISDTVKATGHLSGLGWEWAAVFGVNDATFHQSIDLPELH